MNTLLKALNERESELWEMKAQLRGLPKDKAEMAARRIEVELSKLSRERMAFAMGKVA